ncbi:MAG: AcvB/VirJ family lysyl-phosphatidylglycerol hydrolase [Lysobacterales bacterium]
MKAWFATLLCLFLAPALAADVPSAPPVTASTIAYGLFGTLHITQPSATPDTVAVFVSDRDGWSARAQGLASRLAAAGAFVIGVDLPAYLAQMNSIKARCAYPAGHFEEAVHWVERHAAFANYLYPLLVGDGSGATFAYAVAAQAPAGTFAGLVTLGWDDGFALPESLCAGDAGTMTAAAGKSWRVTPVARLPLRWQPCPFASVGGSSGVTGLLGTLASTVAAFVPYWQPGDAGDSVTRAFADWRAERTRADHGVPSDLSDLPLADIPAEGGDAANAHTIAIMLTGDGGWAGLDRGVAKALAAHGIHVVGFSTLKFFWHQQTPDIAATAIGRIIAHYAAADPLARFELVGYSFGASLVPVIVNRLPPAAQARVVGGVMISPDDAAVFEIHVGDWFGSTKHDDALPIGPEIASSPVPLVCVHGATEDDSYCLKLAGTKVHVVSLPGGHHYNGRYDALGALVADNLPGGNAGTTPSGTPDH